MFSSARATAALSRVALRSLRPEILKMAHDRSPRAALLLTIAGAFFASLFSVHVSLASSTGAVALSSAHNGSISEVGAVVVGILIVTGEASAGSWTTSLTLDPCRSRVVFAKLCVVALAALCVSALSVSAASAGGLVAALLHRGVHHDSVGAFARGGVVVLPAISLVAVLLSLLWSSVGLFLWHRTGAVLTYVLYAVVLTNAAVLAAPELARWLPEGATQALTPSLLMLSIEGHSASTLTLSTGLAVVLLVVLTTCACLLAVVLGLRRDIT